MPSITANATQSESPYIAYSYSYPHKTAYRELSPALPLHQLWQAERRDALFLYIHIPFCEMRCGFCNLFTTTSAGESLITAYMAALDRQAQQVARALDQATFARLAIGGGTPTFLDLQELDQLFHLAEKRFGINPALIPTSIETSPLTATADKLRLLRDRGVSRISIGVQSFDETEVRSIGRPQKTGDVLTALENIRLSGAPNLNIDLIYGIPDQTIQSFGHSIDQALVFAPEEIYLYPLYIRPLTGLGRNEKQHPENRLPLYRYGRDYLLSRGYRQLSMRMFQKDNLGAGGDGPVYCCQTDGMVGIGCGARSYTSTLHYATEYAVSAKPVRSIIERYTTTDDAAFAEAGFGFVLNEVERKRRFVLQSLLQVEGLNLQHYAQQFAGGQAILEFPQLSHYIEEGLAVRDGNILRLTEDGLELSDQLGVQLYSDDVKHLISECSLS